MPNDDPIYCKLCGDEMYRAPMGMVALPCCDECTFDLAEEMLGIVELVRKWQKKGRSGFSLPVIRGDLLGRIEALIGRMPNAPP